MKRSKYNSFNELPLMLTVQDVLFHTATILFSDYRQLHHTALNQCFYHSSILLPSLDLSLPNRLCL